MNLKAWVVSLCLLHAAGVVAQALPTAIGPGSNVTLSGGVSWFQQDYGKRQIGGAFGGLEIRPSWRYAIDSEARVLRLHTSQDVNESSYLAGVKVFIQPQPQRFEPYIKVLAGAGRITLPYRYAHGTFLTYAAGGGLSVNLNDRISVRAIDVEVQRFEGFPFGNLQPYGISTGLSFRLNPMSRFPRPHRHRE